MTHYYLYLLSEQGHIKAREVLTAESDADAVTKAEVYLRNHQAVPGVELWHGERQVKALRQTTAAWRETLMKLLKSEVWSESHPKLRAFLHRFKNLHFNEQETTLIESTISLVHLGPVGALV